MNLSEHFSDLVWTETTVEVEIKGQGKVTWPRYIGTSKDAKTALELIGGPDNIRGITLLGEMSAADLDAVKRNGAYAAVCLAIMCPNWAGRDAWLSHNLKKLRQIGQTTINQSGWKIGLRFDQRSSVLTLKAIRG